MTTNMKICLRNYLSALAIAVMAMAMVGCEPSDANKDYGFPLVYIPQATVTGMDNSYPIPNGPFGQNTKYTCYYKDGKLNIALGVVRAGKLADEKAFTVDLGVSDDETAKKVAELEGKETPAAELSVSLCTIPEKISVPAGDNTGTCYVSVDLQALAADQAPLKVEDPILNDKGIFYKQLVLGLEISNPTQYELAESNTSVIIILDLNSSNWDGLSDETPESAVRKLFPINTTNQ